MIKASQTTFGIRLLGAGLATVLVLLLIPACSPSAEQGATPATEERTTAKSLVIYSGRSKSLVGPLLERFEAASGVSVQVRYGGTAELAATMLEEGEGSPADVFLAQDAAALAAVSAAGLLEPLPEDIRQRVDSRFSAADWVGLSGRARTVVYNTERITVEELPHSLEQVAEERYRGRFGIAPANASLQAHLALYRAVRGGEQLDLLLAALVANDPQRYPKNGAIVEAVINGEVDFGLVNHYYLWRALAERPEAPAKNFWMTEGGGSTFINLAGAGTLSGSDAALELLRFLVSDQAQTYFAAETFEYPLVAGIEPAVELVPLAGQVAEQADFSQVAAELIPAQEAIAASGLLR
nr:major ferric iron-binding protein-like [Nerophis lumbriciformis]